jgi:hypothetical protein
LAKIAAKLLCTTRVSVLVQTNGRRTGVIFLRALEVAMPGVSPAGYLRTGRLVLSCIGGNECFTIDLDTPWVVLVDDLIAGGTVYHGLSFLDALVRARPFDTVVVAKVVETGDPTLDAPDAIAKQLMPTALVSQWNPRNHTRWPSQLRAEVKFLLLAHSRPESALSALTWDALMHVIATLASAYEFKVHSTRVYPAAGGKLPCKAFRHAEAIRRFYE